MLDELPDELLITIINQVCSKPSEYLSLRNTNKYIYSIIHNLTDLYKNKENDYEDDINIICKKTTSIDTFRWIFKNKIKISLKNIKELIINNRYDIFNDGLNYNHFLKMIFNRFYIYIDPHSHNDIFSFQTYINRY